MSELSTLAASPRKPSRRAVAWALVFLSGLLTVTALVLLFTGLTASQPPQPPTTAPGLRSIKVVALPSIVIAPVGHAPIQALPFDGFDFQALDPRTGLLFISHPGPSLAKWQLDQKQLPVGTQFRGQLVVFNTTRQSVVTGLSLPDIHGVAVAPDLGRVYAADVKDDQIYVLDERTLHTIAIIPLGLHPCASRPCESPDGLVYDPVDHRLFVSDNGADPAHQDLGVIDVQSNRFIAEVPLGLDRWGDALGHPQYDPISHRLYLAVQPQAQPTTPPSTSVVLPAAHFVTIDPVSLRVLSRLTLSNTHACSDAHGLVIDAGQQVAFLACVATHTLMLIDLRSMKMFGPWSVVLKPDILRLDLGLHRLYVPGAAGVSILDEGAAAQGRVKLLGTFVVSKGTSHTLEVDPRTHALYFPVQDTQGKPFLRILQFAS
jgi:YVTN family beta-propeller protein